MKMRRIVTAEGRTGVATQVDLIDTAAVDFLTNVWGFDQVPGLPLTPEQVLGEYKPLGIFGPLGGLRVDLFTLAPETRPRKVQRSFNELLRRVMRNRVFSSAQRLTYLLVLAAFGK